MINTLNDQKEIMESLQMLAELKGRAVIPEYHAVETVQEAVSLLERHGKDAIVFSGGTDILSLMKNRIMVPPVMINIKPVRKIDSIAISAESTSIGTLTTIHDILQSPMLKKRFPALVEAAQAIASPIIRRMGTLGGNLCQETRCWYFRRSPETGISFDCRRKSENGRCYAVNGENQYHGILDHSDCVGVCPSDMATVLTALDAKIRTADSDGGRTLSMDELYNSLGTTLHENEMITFVDIPNVVPGTKQRFLKFRIRETIDYAIVSAAAVIKLKNDIIEDARIVLGGVSWKPYRALESEKILVGKRISPDLAEKVANAALAEARPLSKNSHKVEIAKALVKRAIL